MSTRGSSQSTALSEQKQPHWCGPSTFGVLVSQHLYPSLHRRKHEEYVLQSRGSEALASQNFNKSKMYWLKFQDSHTSIRCPPIPASFHPSANDLQTCPASESIAPSGITFHVYRSQNGFSCGLAEPSWETTYLLKQNIMPQPRTQAHNYRQCSGYGLPVVISIISS